MHADGSKKELLWNPVGVSVGFKPDEANCGARINMKGNDVFKYAVKALDGVVDETLEANGLSKQDLDWLIPHQANLRIIEATAKRLEMSMDSVVVDVSHLAVAPVAGDWAGLIGPDLLVDDVAAMAGAIGYEILTSLGQRYVRRYAGE